MVDILSYMCPPQWWALEYHLASVIPGTPAHYCTLFPNFIAHMKSAQGFPWDINFFDEQYVYQNITEVSWTDPRTFKAFRSSSWPASAHGGIALAPRYFDDSGVPGPAPLVTGDAQFSIFTNCLPGPLQPLGKPGSIILTDLQGPYLIDLQGDLGTQKAIMSKYFWGTNLSNLELKVYAQGYGWALWQLFTLNGGVYQFVKESRLNMIVKGGSPALNFPCVMP